MLSIESLSLRDFLPNCCSRTRRAKNNKACGTTGFNEMILANVALPAFFPHSLAALVGIFAIAAIEALFLKRILAANYPDCYSASLSANLQSTFVGIPLAWLLWVVGLVPVSWGLSALGLEMHPLITATTIQTAFFGGIIPSEWTAIGSSLAWIVLLIPFLLGSIWIERKVVSKRFPDCDIRKVSEAVILGNISSYTVFFLLGVYGLVSAVGDYPRQKERFEAFRARQREYKKPENRSAEPASTISPDVEVRPSPASAAPSVRGR